MKRYKLKLKSLKFISAVDTPAQETATTLLIKRASGEAKGVARVVKVDDELGLAFFWALTTKAAGTEYFDLHGDNVVEDDLVKVCAEFMEGARASDEMHDREATGRVVFGFPMTAEIAKAFGIETTTEGFMIAIRPAPDVLTKLKDGTYTGVSIDGTGYREEVVSARKRAALTTATEGHTHLICGVDEMQCGSTSCASMPGVDDYGGYHSHDWIRNEDGSVTIGEQQGHTHELAGSSAPAPGDVAMRAPANGKSTTARGGSMVKGVTHQEPPKMDPTAEIVSLKKQLAAALVLAGMTDAQKAYRTSLSAPAAEAFDALTPEQRAAAVETAKAAALAQDVVLYKRTDGTEIRASQGQLLADIAKQADAAMALAAAEVAKRQEVELAKRADQTLSHFAKGTGPRIALLKAVDGIADEKLRGEVLEMLTGANAACKELGKPQGVNPGDAAAEGDPLATFNKAVETFAKAKDIKDQGLALERFLGTAEGLAAKKAYDATRGYGQQAGAR